MRSLVTILEQYPDRPAKRGSLDEIAAVGKRIKGVDLSKNGMNGH